VCGDCAKFGAEVAGPIGVRRPGNPVVAQRLERRQQRMSERDIYTAPGAEELAEDFGDRIRRAREARGWKQSELGAKVSERESVIAKLESQAMVPTDAMIPKLERTLGIKLREKVESVAVKKQTARAPTTLGDLIRMDEE
jgi:putative transcription factor